MDATERQALGVRIHRAVAASALSREEISRQLKKRGIKASATHLRRWMDGEHEPRVDAIRAIAEITGQDVAALLTDKTAKAVAEPRADYTVSTKVQKWGEWMEELPPKIRQEVMRIGNALRAWDTGPGADTSQTRDTSRKSMRPKSAAR